MSWGISNKHIRWNTLQKITAYFTALKTENKFHLISYSVWTLKKQFWVGISHSIFWIFATSLPLSNLSPSGQVMWANPAPLPPGHDFWSNAREMVTLGIVGIDLGITQENYSPLQSHSFVHSLPLFSTWIFQNDNCLNSLHEPLQRRV